MIKSSRIATKHKELSLNVQHLCGKLGMATSACNHSTERVAVSRDRQILRTGQRGSPNGKTLSQSNKVESDISEKDNLTIQGSKAFSEALLKGQSLLLCPCPGVDLERSSLGLVLVHRNLALPPLKETGVISPKATMCSVCDVLGITCVPFCTTLFD